jgi:hypothetical protein
MMLAAVGLQVSLGDQDVKRIISVPMKDGGTVELEIEDNTTSPVMRGGVPQPVVEKAVGSFEAAISRIKPAAMAVVEQFADAVDGTSSVKVKFSVKFSAGAGAIIASVGSEANFEIEVTWNRDANK